MESSSKPFNELTIPDVNFKSSLNSLPNGYPAAIILCNFFGDLLESSIKFLFLRSDFLE